MIAKYERRAFNNNENIWIGKYKNLSNLPHFHNECEIVFIEKGTASVLIEGESYKLDENDFILILSGETHSIRASEDSLLIICLFSEKILNKINSSYILKNKIINDPKLLFPLKDMMNEYKKRNDYYIIEMESILLRTLVEIYRNNELTKFENKSKKNIEIYKSLLKEIDQKYAFYTFDEAADYMCFSRAYFSRFFYKMSGMNFTDYLNQIKIEKAIELINETDKPITLIALEIGYTSIRNFNRMFKTYTGYTPTSLPKNYVYSFRHIKYHDDSFNPTESNSILLI